MVSTLTSYQPNLANYFASKPLYLDEPTQKKPNTRKLVEQPWQELEAAKIVEKQFEIDSKIKEKRKKNWDNVTNTLCNLDFIQAKAAAKMTYELVNDFNEVLLVIPDNKKNIQEEKARQVRLDKYTKDLIRCACGETTVQELEIPKSITPWTKEQIDAEIEKIKTNPTRADLLKEFQNFISREACNLQNYAHEIANFSIQQAWNFVVEGPIGNAAEKSSQDLLNQLLLCNNSSRPQWNPFPQVIRTLGDHTDIVYAIAVTSDGKLAISGSGDNSCILWDIQSGKPIFKLIGHSSGINDVDITPDGRFAISASWDKTSILWDLQTGTPIHILKGHTESVQSVAITPDGSKAFTGSRDTTCIFWDLKYGKPIRILTGHRCVVWSVAITPNGYQAISASDESVCILWNLRDGKSKKNLNVDTGHINSVSITPDGKRALLGAFDGSCILWNLQTEHPIQTFKFHTYIVEGVAMTPDGKYGISASRDESCILWDLTSGEVLQNLHGHKHTVQSVAITPDGKNAISASVDKTCILWDLISGQQSKIIKWHNDYVSSVTITPDGNHIISTSADKKCILWDIKSEVPLRMFDAHKSIVSSAAVTSDGERLLTGSWDDTCILWNLKTGKLLQTLIGHTGFVRTVAISPDGKKAVSGSWDKTCILWDVIKGVPIRILKRHDYPITDLDITPDGCCVISPSVDKTCIIWNLNSGEPIQTLIGHTKNISKVIFTPDGHRAVSGSIDGSCILWNLKTGEPIYTVKWHSDEVWGLSISADGAYVVSVSRDKTCIFWELESGNLLSSRFISSSFLCSVAFTPNGICIGSSSGEVILIKLGNYLLNTKTLLVNIRQIWDFELNRFTIPLADCPLCRHRFEPPKGIIYAILQILQATGIPSDQSPCLELPDEAWEHPALLGECPNCHEKLKFNPFFGSDVKGITDYYFSKEREQLYQFKFDEAEEAFKEENWETAYNLYLKLVQQGYFDINYIRYNMAICKLNTLFTDKPEIINNISNLIKLLNDKGAKDKAQIIDNKLKERLDTIKREELTKKKAETPWWKKLF